MIELIEKPPVCSVDGHWFIGVQRSQHTGQWLYSLVGGEHDDWSFGEITHTYGTVTWFVLTEAEHLDGDTPL